MFDAHQFNDTAICHFRAFFVYVPQSDLYIEGTMLATVLMAPQAVGLGIQIGCG